MLDVMKRRIMTRFVVGSLVALAAACGAPPPHATAMDAQRANVALAELEAGRTLLLQKCGRCHAVPHPNRYAAVDWPAKVDDMTERSKIDPAQRTSIELYLMTMSGR
jgi:hypothetical protein